MAALALIGTLVSAAGTVAGGIAEKNSSEFEAKQIERNGKEEFAASQRDAAASRKEADLANSRAQALAASSGGGAGADAPTIVKIMSDTAGQGAYNAQTKLYGGMSRKAGAMDQAAGRRASGKASFMGSLFSAAGGFAKGVYTAKTDGAFG